MNPKNSRSSRKGTFNLTGSVLALVPRINGEAVAGLQWFETSNESGEVGQRYKQWKVKEGSGELETGVATLKLGEKPAALEGGDQAELPRVSNKRGLFGVHE
jgi:hypothetical protein